MKKTKKIKRDWFQTMAQRIVGTLRSTDPEETPTSEVLQQERGPAVAILSSRVEPPAKRSFLKGG
jgi:hypothetical protein